MRIKIFTLIVCSCWLLYTTSCKQSNEHFITPDTSAEPLPYSTHPIVNIDTNAVWGVLLVRKINGGYNGLINGVGEEACAWFYNEGHDVYVQVDTVTFNGFDCGGAFYTPDNRIIKTTDFSSLYYTQTPTLLGYVDFNIDSNIFWSVVSHSNNLSFDYNYTGYFPSFRDTINDTYSKINGMRFLLDSSTVSGADSVEISIGNGNSVAPLVHKICSSHAGVVNIDISGLTIGNKYNLGIISYSTDIHSFNGRPYAFIKQEFIYKYISIIQ